MERKIVIGYEPTTSGNDALHLGRLLAEVLAATPVVATVVPRNRSFEGMDGATFADVEHALDGIEHENRTVAARSPVGGLRRLAADAGAPLIVLGSSWRGPAGKALMGGTGESLIHGAECAVAVAPIGFADRHDARLLSVGAAFDGSGEAWSALTTAISLVQRTHGSLEVLTADDFPLFNGGAPWSTLAAGELGRIEQERKRRTLELALSAVAPTGVSAEGKLLSGDAGEALLAASAELDLLIAGSRSQGMLLRTFIGSTTRRLLRGSSCPVLVLPRQLRADPLGLDCATSRLVGPIPAHAV
jgi:nucleotide-binding universal stress UspA family protein